MSQQEPSVTSSSATGTLARAVVRSSAAANSVAELVLWILVAVSILVTFTQVVFRYGLNSSLSWSEELARYTFVWIIFLGASVATRRKQHIAVEVIVSLLPQPLRAAAEVLGIFMSAIFFALLAWVGWLLARNAWEQYSTALDVRIAWVYAAAPVGALLSLLHLCAGWLERSRSGRREI